MRRADRALLVRRLAAPGLIALLGAAPLTAQQRDTTSPAPRAVTLAQAIKLAEQVQPRVVQAQANVEDAGARLRTAKGQYLPNLQFSSSGSNFRAGGAPRLDQATGQIIPGGSSSTSLSTNLSASLDLFTGFRRGADVRSARASTAAADASLVDARFQQRLATTTAFLGALSNAELKRVREASVTRAEEQLKVSVAKLHAGSATRSDSLRSLVTLGTAQLQLVQADAQLAASEAALARLIGAPGRVAALDDSTFHKVITSIDTAALLSDARAASPQVRAAEASATAADASVRSARSAYWPSLTLAANTGFNGNNSQDYRLYNSRQVSLQLSWSLFNRFNREQQIALQESARDVAVATASDTRRAVESGLIEQIAALDAARTQIDITATSVAAATEDLRVVQERYRLGVATIVDVLTSQEALTQAQVDEVSARYAYLTAKAQIEALIGRDL
jgi:outer membrane protein